MKMDKILIMKKKFPVTVLLVVFLICGIAVSVPGMLRDIPDKSQARGDVLLIDSMTVFGKRTRPAVPFLHDKHTSALTKMQKDCSTCHLSEKNILSLKFQRLADQTKKAVMDTYHNGCIGCHKDLSAVKKKSGPVICAECHIKDVSVVSSRKPAGMNKYLHFLHTDTLQNKCELCHHEYNKKDKKLFYAKGKEGTCRYCHKGVKEENRMSMRQASHTACLDCHLKTIAKKQNAGPVQCSGCHDSEKPLKSATLSTLPRLERKQPDMVMIKTGNKELDTSGTAVMNFVPFDHKAHEAYNDTCRVCHHEDLKACNTCHLLKGVKDGRYINLEQAMHTTGACQSCLGCHSKKQQTQNCSGCHMFIPEAGNDKACLKCHSEPPPGEKAKLLTEQYADQAAAKMLSSVKRVKKTYPDQDIPEKVIISVLSDKYDPVDFPHRKIVKKINAGIQNNKLAEYFHTSEGTLCKGCHHNAPESKNPPRCASCHEQKPLPERISSKPDKNMLKPALMGAYHIQCMDCHVKMGIEKNSCTDCHQEKKNK